LPTNAAKPIAEQREWTAGFGDVVDLDVLRGAQDEGLGSRRWRSYLADGIEGEG